MSVCTSVRLPATRIRVRSDRAWAPQNPRMGTPKPADGHPETRGSVAELGTATGDVLTELLGDRRVDLGLLVLLQLLRIDVGRAR